MGAIRFGDDKECQVCAYPVAWSIVQLSVDDGELATCIDMPVDVARRLRDQLDRAIARIERKAKR